MGSIDQRNTKLLQTRQYFTTNKALSTHLSRHLQEHHSAFRYFLRAPEYTIVSRLQL